MMLANFTLIQRMLAFLYRAHSIVKQREDIACFYLILFVFVFFAEFLEKRRRLTNVLLRV